MFNIASNNRMVRYYYDNDGRLNLNKGIITPILDRRLPIHVLAINRMTSSEISAINYMLNEEAGEEYLLHASNELIISEQSPVYLIYGLVLKRAGKWY